MVCGDETIDVKNVRQRARKANARSINLFDEHRSGRQKCASQLKWKGKLMKNDNEESGSNGCQNC